MMANTNQPNTLDDKSEQIMSFRMPKVDDTE